MTNLTYTTHESYTEDGWKHYNRDILLDGKVIGDVAYMTNLSEDEDVAYIEDFGINPEHQNKGFGTQVLKAMANEFWMAYLAPTNEDNQRLYERVGEEISGDEFDSVDQGFGVYELNK